MANIGWNDLELNTPQGSSWSNDGQQLWWHMPSQQYASVSFMIVTKIVNRYIYIHIYKVTYNIHAGGGGGGVGCY